MVSGLLPKETGGPSLRLQWVALTSSGTQVARGMCIGSFPQIKPLQPRSAWELRDHRGKALGCPQAEVQGWPVGAGTLSGLLRWPRREDGAEPQAGPQGKEGKPLLFHASNRGWQALGVYKDAK